jgi:hypothetical protein
MGPPIDQRGSPQCSCQASHNGYREQLIHHHLGNQIRAGPLSSVSEVRPVLQFEYERSPVSIIQPEETSSSAKNGFEFVYPDMLNTCYDAVPQYSAPAWMLSHPLPRTLPAFESSAYIRESLARSHRHRADDLSYQQTTPGNSRPPHVPTSDVQMSIPLRSPPNTYELEGQDLLRTNAQPNRANVAESYQVQRTAHPGLQKTTEEARTEFAHYHYAPTVPLAELSASIIETRSESRNDVTVTSLYSAVELQQGLSLPPHKIIGHGLRRVPNEIRGSLESLIHPTVDLEAPQPQARKSRDIVEFDSFCTPANQSFYSVKPYIELNQKLKELRLLRVFPKKPLRQHYDQRSNWNLSRASGLAKDQEVLACEIEKTSLARIGNNYVTISYCAGDPNKTALIIVDGIPFNAFANLEHAIDRLSTHWTSSHPGEPLLLWADQISINQSDKDERSAQVQIMRDIYRRSAETYVCMSVPNVEDCLAWVPRPLVQSRSADTIPGRKSRLFGVTVLKYLLLDLLVGKDKGGRLRSAASKPTVNSDVPSEQTQGSARSVEVGFAQRVLVERCNTFPRTRSPWKAGAPHQGCIRSLTIDGTVGTPSADITEVSAMVLQSSLAKFMTNKWWRRYRPS